MKLLSVSEMQAVERQADAAGLSYDEMMDHAGFGVARALMDFFPDMEGRSVLGLVGSGNNGGDALVALTFLAGTGWKTTAYLVRPRAEGDRRLAEYQEAGGYVIEGEDKDDYAQLIKLVESHSALIDGVLGTGARLPLKPEAAAPLEAARRTVEALGDGAPFVLAVDCPSGVDCDSGECAAETIPADMTVTMAAAKDGLVRLPAFEMVGELLVAPIGDVDSLNLEAWSSPLRSVADAEMVAGLLPKRPMDAHKGTFGTVLAAAGSVNYTGAALLAGKAAYRIGAGLVTLAVPAPLHAALAGQFPEATWLLLPHDVGVIAADAADVIQEGLSRATALLVGPGIGMEETTLDFLRRLFGGQGQQRRPGIGFVHTAGSAGEAAAKSLPPLVIDADGLKLLAKLPGWPTRLLAPAVLTPHPGEMAVLTGLSKDEIQAGRWEIAERYAKEWGHVVVLKGALTVVASPDGRTCVIPIASAALARAGTGDVLAGLIVGLRAQGLPAFEAALAGAWIHAQAGLLAADLLGSDAPVLASDVLDAVAEIVASL